jgi:hypothetical protein
MLCRVSPIVAVLFFFSLAAVGTALAQPTPPAQVSITPAPNCEKPGDPPGIGGPELSKEAAERRRSTWSKNMKAYFECLKHFIDEHQAAAAPHIRAANAAVDEYNKAIKIYNDQVDAAKPAQ